MSKQHYQIFKIISLFFFFLTLSSSNIVQKGKENIFVIALHGGAGNISHEKLTEEVEYIYRYHLNQALTIGYTVLHDGGSALDAVEKTIMYLEDCPFFNAGKGAVKNLNGNFELDASIMDGKELNAGAVAVVTNIKNPISAARIVMTKTRHVLLSGEGASHFAKKHGLEIVDSNYYRIVTEEMLEKNGTIGCVALDKEGNLAAGTSTGGLAKKLPGRIGDSPIIGAGTYANNACCAISSTGQGEYFMRYVIAYNIASLMLYKGLSIEEAANESINKTLHDAGGYGGIIGIDKKGNVVTVFNTSAMFRAYAKSTGEKAIEVF